MKTGLSLIATERKRQLEEEGWTPEHDDEHNGNQLADAAICYLVDPDHRDYAPFPWPWEDDAFKPSMDRIRELVKAGALVAAEIDRRLRNNGEYIEENPLDEITSQRDQLLHMLQELVDMDSIQHITLHGKAVELLNNLTTQDK